MEQTPVDCSKKFVRVTGIRNQHFVEFDFAIGEPELFVEMILPLEQFDLFCAKHQVQQLDAAAAAAIEQDKQQWRIGVQSSLNQRITPHHESDNNG